MGQANESRQVSGAVAAVISVALAYFVLGKLSAVLAIPPGYAAAVWPAAGLGLAAVVLLGRRAAGGVWLGSFLLNLGLSAGAAGPAAFIALGASLQALVGAGLVRWAGGFPVRLVSQGEVGRFMSAGLASCLVSPSVGVSTLFMAGMMADQSLVLNWMTWWVGDAVGLILAAPAILIWFTAPQARSRNALVSALMAVCLLALGVFFDYARRQELQRLDGWLSNQSEASIRALEREVERAASVLDAVAMLYQVNHRVDVDQFHSFVQGVVRGQRILAVEWAPRITRAERSSFLLQARRSISRSYEITEVAPGGELTPAPDRAFYDPVLYIVPREQNWKALGYDVSSEPYRREALEESRSSGRPVATRPIALLRGEPGLLVFRPVTRPANGEYLGTVLGVFRIIDLVESALEGPSRQDFHVRIFDVTRGERATVASLPGSSRRSVASRSSRFQVAGRTWELQLSPSARYDQQVAARYLGVLSSAGLFVLLLSALVLIASGRGVELERLVAERTRELSTEIAERKLVEQDLRRAHAAAESANRAKSQFLANMSHELKTPLNAVIGFSQLLRDQSALDPRASRYIDNVLQSANRLLGLIHDLLDFSRIEAGRFELRPQRVSFAEVARQAMARVDRAAASKGLHIAVELPEDGPELQADPVRLQQILYNLLDNAIKFTLPGGTVTLGCATEADRLTAVVSDTGIGIAPGDQTSIFGNFEQVDASLSRQHGGAGMGLALTRRLVQLHGGRIWVESEGVPGRGSTFRVELPLQGPLCQPGA
ncbi:MAG: CHASE domain-containing protein [Armatimonadetes bacterium]|nr:CHASE domain-containing protein [Armatimonadota bacterium]